MFNFNINFTLKGSLNNPKILTFKEKAKTPEDAVKSLQNKNPELEGILTRSFKVLDDKTGFSIVPKTIGSDQGAFLAVVSKLTGDANMREK